MHLPAPLRAAVGLAATAADEARRLPERALELPMLAVSTALQASVRAQQRYARLTARGDAVLNRTRPTDEPPAWAAFDDPLSDDELRRAPAQAAPLIGELIDGDEADPQGAPNGAQPDVPAAEPAHEPATRWPAAATRPRQPPAKKTPAVPSEPGDSSTAGPSNDATPDHETR